MKKEKPYHSIKKPHFLGDKKAFREFLDKNLVYPKEALENKVSGVAHIKCEISDTGKVLRTDSINKLGYGLDEEAQRLCKLMQFENTTERGLKIKHSTTVKIPFVLPKPPAKVEKTVNITYQVTPSESKPKTEGGSGGYNYTIKF